MDLDNAEKVLYQIKNKFEKLVNSFENDSTVRSFYSGDRRSRSEMRTPRREEGYRRRSSSWQGRPFTKSGHKRTFSRPRGGSRSREREPSQDRRQYEQTSSGNSHQGSIHNTYTCEKFNLSHPDIKGKEDSHNVFMTGTEKSGVVDCGGPKSVVGKL